MVRALLDWLVPQTDHPGRTRDYSRLLSLLAVAWAAWWVLSMLPVAYPVLAGPVVLALLLAGIA
jgi:hypothetical protein